MTRCRAIFAFLCLILAGACLATWRMSRAPAVEAAPVQQAASPGPVQTVMVGHEYRQDDFPSIAAAPDGSLWVAWLSFAGDRDDIAIRHWSAGKWGNLQWVPNTSGDSWMPQVGVDARNRLWVVWSQMLDGNWDLYARRFDAATQSWGRLERLSSDPLPDINPRLASDGKGRLAVVWQGFRGRHSNIFLRILEGEQWSPEVRVTNRAANDWEPAVALGEGGVVWVAYDTYQSGDYNVSLARVEGGAVRGGEIPVATTPRFEARATVAVDRSNRVWVAWEQGEQGWGKDQGYILRNNPKGVQLGGRRSPQIRCYENGQWKEPVASLASAFPKGNVNTYQPHVFIDALGSVWVAAKPRLAGERAVRNRAARGFWQYALTRLDGDRWTEAVLLPNSKGRSSTRIHAAATGGALWLVWDTDNRPEQFYHRPLRQQVYAGRVEAVQGATPVLGPVKQEMFAQVIRGHADEPGDLQAIRSYTATVGGKTLRIYRGDFHRHTEFSWDGGGGADGSLQDFYRYMIDVAGMDFGASTDHQGGAHPYWWWYSQKLTDMYHVPGAYAAIFGYERSASFPNGHRNIFFARRGDAKVTPFLLKEGVRQFALGDSEMGDEPGIGTGELVENDTKLLYEEVRRLKGVIISHTSGTRMGTDWRDNDPELEPVVEIFQGARTNYEQLGAPYVADPGKDGPHIERAGYQKEGMLSNAWAKGYKLGIITSSDHGSTHISYAMVYADDFSRDGILNAIRKRHTYGATDNIILDVRMGAHFMGDEFPLSRPLPLRVKARGTGPVARVDIIKDSTVIYSTEPKKQEVDFEYIDKGDLSGRHYVYVRLMQQDGMIAWSSPMFINYGK